MGQSIAIVTECGIVQRGRNRNRRRRFQWDESIIRREIALEYQNPVRIAAIRPDLGMAVHEPITPAVIMGIEPRTLLLNFMYFTTRPSGF